MPHKRLAVPAAPVLRGYSYHRDPPVPSAPNAPYASPGPDRNPGCAGGPESNSGGSGDVAAKRLRPSGPARGAVNERDGAGLLLGFLRSSRSDPNLPSLANDDILRAARDGGTEAGLGVGLELGTPPVCSLRLPRPPALVPPYLAATPRTLGDSLGAFETTAHKAAHAAMHGARLERTGET